MNERPEFMVAYRASDRRVLPLAIYRRDCCRCGTSCALTPASASAADDHGLAIVCLNCLTRDEQRAMQAAVYRSQLEECARYTAGLMG
jgi:hypothetical protein